MLTTWVSTYLSTNSHLLQLFEEWDGDENVTDMKNHLYGLCYQMKMFELLLGLCLIIETLAVIDQLAAKCKIMKVKN